MARLQEYYKETVVAQLMERLGLDNPMAVPRIEKVTLNMGVGETTSDRKTLDHAMEDLQKITGQKPVMTRARKSV
ncbi:MAG: 50S ribosomal protein L5, partial [Gammaproteobacteria bacterium]